MGCGEFGFEITNFARNNKCSRVGNRNFSGSSSLTHPPEGYGLVTIEGFYLDCLQTEVTRPFSKS